LLSGYLFSSFLRHMRSPCCLCFCVPPILVRPSLRPCSPLMVLFSLRSLLYRRKIRDWLLPELLICCKLTGPLKNFQRTQDCSVIDILDIIHCPVSPVRSTPYLLVRRQGLALSIGPNWVGFYLRTETESSLRNVVF
jgi:hypothetical protein